MEAEILALEGVVGGYGKLTVLNETSFKVARAWEIGAGGLWAMELDSGAVWRQTDGNKLSRRPKPGSTVEIRSAALGSYFMNVDGQTAIRVKRDR